MATILTVCTGNVCRSPLVERLLQQGLDAAYGPGAVDVTSAGTGALVGSAMDERAARLLDGMGGSGSGFVARWLEPDMVAGVDLVLTATREHRGIAVQHAPRALRRTFTVRELAHLVKDLEPTQLPDDPAERLQAVTRHAAAHRGSIAALDPADLDIVDPYRQPDETYELMRAQVAPAVEQILRALTA